MPIDERLNQKMLGPIPFICLLKIFQSRKGTGLILSVIAAKFYLAMVFRGKRTKISWVAQLAIIAWIQNFRLALI